MNKHFYLIISCLVVMTVHFSHAQVEYSTYQNVRISSPAFTPYTTIEGSPYVPSDTMQNGWLVVSTKQVPVKLRYNSYAGTVEYMKDDQLLTPASTVSEFVVLKADTMRFQKGFPATQTRTVNDFYQVLYNGRKSKLIKYIVAVVKTNNDAMGSDFGKKKFQSREEYYVWVANGQSTDSHFVKLSDGDVKPAVMSKKSLTSLFPKNSEGIDHYLNDQRIKLKSWAEFASVLKFIDTQ